MGIPMENTGFEQVRGWVGYNKKKFIFGILVLSKQKWLF